MMGIFRDRDERPIPKAANAIDEAADVWRAVGLVVLQTLRGWGAEGKIKGRVKIGLGPLPWKLTIEGEIDLPTQE